MTVTTDKVRISLYLDPELKPRLERLAKKEKRSLSNLIEILCEKYADEAEKAEE